MAPCLRLLSWSCSHARVCGENVSDRLLAWVLDRYTHAVDLAYPDPVVVATQMGLTHSEEVSSTCTGSRSIVDLSCRSSLVLVTLHVMVVMW